MPASAISVPLADPSAENALLRTEILSAITRTVDGKSYILGPEVTAFEKAMSRDLWREDGKIVGVGSGTDALVLSLIALGIGLGDEVVTVSHTAGPSVAAILVTGATPVLVDVDEETFCICPRAVEAAIGPRTKAILVVHLYGHPAEMDGIIAIAAKREIAVVEDCAQAQGARHRDRAVGTIGAAGCFSFYPTKNLGAIGDGGAITARDMSIVERVRSLRVYGWREPQYAEIPRGRCSRLDEIQAAILSVKLPHLSQSIERRRALAGLYRSRLSGLPIRLPVEKAQCWHTYHLFVIQAEDRDALAAHLAANGIATGRHYPFPAHLQPALVAGSRMPQPLTVTERLSARILSLPLFTTMTDGQLEHVATTMRAYYANS